MPCAPIPIRTRAAIGLLCAVAAAGLIHPKRAPAGAEATGAWSLTQAMGDARASHTATALDDGRILVAGGRRGGTAIRDAEVYDPDTGAWTEVPAMAAARADHTATALADGRVLVAGGDDAGTAEIFDPAASDWSAAGTMTVPRASHGAAQLPDGRVLVVGGSRDARAEVFDPATGAWDVTGSLATPRARGHTVTALADGRVLVAGGATAFDDPAAGHMVFVVVDTTEVYDPATGSFTPGGSLLVGRQLHTATPLADGRVLVAGGVDGRGSPRRSAELIDPATGVVAAGESMAAARYEHVAVALGDGRVLVAGGVAPDGISDPRGAEVFDPAGPAWSPAHSTALFRARAAAAMLPDGRVLLTGGVNRDGAELAAAEIFDPAAATPADVVPPGRVTNLSTTPMSPTSVRITFAAVGSNGADPPPAPYYVVKQSLRPIDTLRRFRRAPALCGGLCEVFPGRVGNTVSVQVDGVLPDTTYFFALRAVDEAGNRGPLSNTASVRTFRVPPGRVDDLTGRARSATSVVLKWSAPGANRDDPPPAERFVVKRARRPIDSRRDFAAATKLCTCRYHVDDVGERLRLIVRGLAPDTPYHFAMRAKDDAGNLGPRSASVRIKTLGI